MEKNQKLLVANSALMSAYNGFTSVYLAAFALVLGASNTVVGLLGALPWLAQIITQIPGAELCQRFARKKIFMYSSFIGRLFWIPIIATPFLFNHPVLLIVVFYMFVTLFEEISQPAILSITADVVPETDRGYFSATRLKLIGLMGVISIALGGLWLQQFPKESPAGFAIMFGVGIALGIYSILILRKADDVPYIDNISHPIKEFFTLTGQLKHFVIFSVIFNFARMLSSPFFTVFFLVNLGMSYEFYGIASAIAVLSRVIFSNYIGRLTDKFGDKPVAIIATIGIGFVPLLYLGVTPELVWLVIPLQLFTGLVWGALEISQFNLLIGVTSPEKRALQIAETNFYSSIPLVIAPIIGGWMIDNVTLILSGIPLIFLISGILRLASALFLFKLKEPRKTGEHKATEVLYEIAHFHPIKGIVHAVHVFKRVTGGLIK